MTTTFEPAGAAAQSEAPAQLSIETPFLETPPATWAPAPVPAQPGLGAESPFMSEYAAGEQTVRPEEPALRELLEDLYDAEFDEAVAELVAEAETYVGELGLGESESDQARAEQLLEAWIDPLRREAQTMLLGLAEVFESEDPASMTEDRLEAVFERLAPAGAEHGPAFEGFLSSLAKKAKGLVKGAVKAAKAGVAAVSKIMPIGIILRKLAALARPMLNRVLRFALNKLPVEYRDPARQLARRFLGITVAEALDEYDGEGEDLDEAEWESEGPSGTFEQPATADLRQIQDEFDAEAAGLVFAPSEQEQDLYLAEASVAGAAVTPSPLAALDAARARFVEGMTRLDESADPTPLVENFLPAILPALRLGVRVAGRPRVVRFLARYLGRLIAPYVGPTVTPGLSRAIVDAGLRSMTLEAPEGEVDEASAAVAAEAFASLVEDTVARVAQLPEAELDHEVLVEEAAYTGFHQSAAATFPSEVLSEHNEYLEAGRARGTWVPMPRSGPWRYRKYSRVFNVVIHPAAARSIRTFAGQPLSAFLRDGLGRSGPVRARVHLYQAVPGSSVARIARAERGVPGLGSSDARARSRLHPLTPMAAAALIGEPGLGREVSEVHDDRLGPLAIGQRLYYLEVPNATATPLATGADAPAPDAAATTDPTPTTEPTPTTTTTPAPAPVAGAPTGQPRGSDARCSIDPASGVVTVTIYTSEADAQGVATRLRRKEPLGASLAVLRRIYGPALGAARRQRVRVRSEHEGEDEVLTEDLLRRPPGFGRPPARRRTYRPLLVRRRVSGARRRRPRYVRRPLLVSWVARALAVELDRSRDAFLQAADAPADGVTVVLRLRPPGIRALLSAGAAQVAAAAAGPGQVEVEITPGRPVRDHELVAVRSQVARQVAHWRAAVVALDNLDNFASPDAWSRLERDLGTSLRANLRGAVDRISRDGEVLVAELRAADTADELEALRRHVVRFRRQFLRVETALEFYGGAVNDRSSPRLGALLAACDILAVRAMDSILTPLGRPVPPVLTYVDKGLGASILRAGLRLWDGQTLSVAAAIKLTRHNLNGRPTSLLHEAGHQIGFMLGWNDELAAALRRELSDDPELAEAWSSWSGEIVGDCVGFVHAGYAAVAALHDVIAGESVNVYARRPFDPHPVAHLRVLLGTAMATRFYGEGPWSGLARAWLIAHPVSRAPRDVRPLIERSIPRLPRIVEVCLLDPARAFGGQPLTALVDPMRVRPDALAALARDAGASLGTSSHWLWSESLRLLALSGYRAASEPDRTPEIAADFEAWMLRLGGGTRKAA